jgi:hypothetical protein
VKVQLRQMVEGALAASPSTDPHEIALKLVAGLNDDELRPALECTLPYLVKQLQARQNNQAVEGLHGPTSRGVSWLERSVCVKRGVWKPLGNCTPRDLRRIARFRQMVADQHAAWVRRYERLADAVQGAGEKRLRDVDPQVVRSILS